MIKKVIQLLLVGCLHNLNCRLSANTLIIIQQFYQIHIIPAGFSWAYNTQLYFQTYYPSFNLGVWVSAVSIIGGSIGVALGGFVSDKLVPRLGPRARLYVLAASQVSIIASICQC